MIRRRVDYDRKRLLAAAEQARAQRKHRRAIALYRRVLAAEPHDAAIHARIAPLLAARGERFDAWRSYQQAAQAQLRNRSRGEALAIYQDATRTLPTQIDAWRAVAKLELANDHREAALRALIEGRSKFRSRRQRPEAIALLREAREIDAWRVDIVLDLARLLRRAGQATEAQWILRQLADRIRGRELRTVCGAQWRIEPSLRNSWNWLRAACAAANAPRRGAAPLRCGRAQSRST